MKAFFSLFLLLSLLHPVRAEKKIEVVTSFSILADFVKAVGGGHVHVVSIIPPDSDPHFYQPTPDIAALVSHADLVVMNGLGFEGWISRLLEAAKYKGPILIATEGIRPRIIFDPGLPSTQAVPDPHAWHDAKNAMIYVKNISAALIRLDPARQKDYETHTRKYIQQLNQVDTWIRREFSKILPEKRKIISVHDAFGYFAARYGFTIYALQGLSTESEPSAKQIAALIELIKKNHIHALFCENIANRQLLEQVASETNIAIGGTLYSDALSDDQGPARTYLALMRHNVQTLSAALKRDQTK